MLLFLLFYLIVIPISILLHEIGHGLGILLFSKERIAKVYLGPINESNKETFRFFRMHFHITWAFYGFCSYTGGNKNLTKVEAISSALGGPLVSLIISITAFISVSFIEGTLTQEYMKGIAIFNLINFIMTIIPIKYPKWWGIYSGRPSDGYRIVTALRGTEM
jgi:hypothetical protein